MAVFSCDRGGSVSAKILCNVRASKVANNQRNIFRLRWMFKIPGFIFTCFIFILAVFPSRRKLQDRRISLEQNFIKSLIGFDTLVSVFHIDKGKVGESLGEILGWLDDCIPTIQSVLDNLRFVGISILNVYAPERGRGGRYTHSKRNHFPCRGSCVFP